MRRNAFATIYDVTPTLRAGHRVAGQDTLASLWDGPVAVSSPTRPVEQAASLEGGLDLVLYAHARADLSGAQHVTVRQHPTLSGDYGVLQTTVTGTMWRLSLRKVA